MKYIVDIDGTICSQTKNGNYHLAKPYQYKIDMMNHLYDSGHEVHYWTARGMTTGKDYSELTKKQFDEWGIKYHSLSFRKPSYDLWIDDKCINQRDFFGIEL